MTGFGIELELLVVNVCYDVPQLLDRDEFLADRGGCPLGLPMGRTADAVAIIDTLVLLIAIRVLLQNVIHDGLAGRLILLLARRRLLCVELLPLVKLLLLILKHLVILLSVESSTATHV